MGENHLKLCLRTRIDKRLRPADNGRESMFVIWDDPSSSAAFSIKKLLSAERGGSSWLLGILRTRTRGIVSPGSLLRHRFYISGPPTTAPEYVPEYVPEDAGDPEDIPEYANGPKDVPEYRLNLQSRRR